MADTSSIHHEMFDCVQARDFGRLRDLYHPECQYEASDGTTGGIDIAVGVAETYTAAFPDLSFEIRHEFACGDMSVIEFRATGTQTGDLEGVPATGRRVEVDVCNVVEVRDGRVYREREYFDALSMMQQLGVTDGATAPEGALGSIVAKNFDAPDEIRQPTKTRVDVVDLGAAKAARLTMQPGWRWSECIKPVVGGDSCQARHVRTLVAGSLHVIHDDGTSVDLKPGDAYIIEPGHDAWVLGDDAAIGFEFESKAAESYARG